MLLTLMGFPSGVILRIVCTPNGANLATAPCLRITGLVEGHGKSGLWVKHSLGTFWSLAKCLTVSSPCWEKGMQNVMETLFLQPRGSRHLWGREAKGCRVRSEIALKTCGQFLPMPQTPFVTSGMSPDITG